MNFGINPGFSNAYAAYGYNGRMPMGGIPAIAATPADRVMPTGNPQLDGYVVPQAPNPAPERFLRSETGGMILNADGQPTGTVPTGSVFDCKTGNVYDADGKAITIPDGSTVDFYDLPDTDILSRDYGRTTPSGIGVVDGGGGAAPMKFGPLDKGQRFGHFDSLVRTTSGGPLSADTAVAGASGLGQTPGTMEASLQSLMATLQQLVAAISQMQTAVGGGMSPAQGMPGQVPPSKGVPGLPPHRPLPPLDARPAIPKVPTTPPSTDSSSSSDVSNIRPSGSA